MIQIDTIDFLNTLYGSCESGWLTLWTKQDKKTAWLDVTNHELIADTAQSVEQDIYFGVGISNQRKPEGRLSADDVTAIPGLWIDIDIAGQEHKQNNLPAGLAEATEFMNSLPFEPTIIVDSGHGLHAYWLFREMWSFDTPEERNQAKGLLKGFQDFIRSRATARGWKLDATHDLSRVLRLPGTVNYKSKPVPVTVISHNDNRYNPSDFEQYAAAITAVEKRDKFKRNPSDGPASRVIDNCIFIQTCRDHAHELSEPQWVAMLSNIARCSDGPEVCHELSRPYVGYSGQETNDKIFHVLNGLHPQTCEYIRNTLGFGMCPDQGCGVKSPCGWALKKAKKPAVDTEILDKPVPDGFFDNNMDWQKQLARTDKGVIYNTPANVKLILENDPKLKGKFSYDITSMSAYRYKGLPWSTKDDNYMFSDRKVISDADYKSLCNYLHDTYNITKQQVIENAFAEFCLSIQENPLIDYLNSLEWDGVSRVDTLLIDYFNAEDSAYVRAVTRKTLTALIRRAYSPGVKFDTCLILKGSQGIGKSTFFNILGGKWYTDGISITNDQAKTFESHRGKWLCEMGELTSMRKTESERLKSFFSTQVDRYRPPYGKNVLDVPRSFIVVGTTNNDEFLKDITGNRRYWPVILNGIGKKSVFKNLQGERDQIIAEAKTIHFSGENVYLPPELEREATAIQKDFIIRDAWADRIENFLDNPLIDKVCTEMIFMECLKGNIERFSPIVKQRIDDVMCCIGGWEKSKTTIRIKEYGIRRGWKRINQENPF